MVTKTFQTLFNISAKYTGKPAFASANRDIDKTQRNITGLSAGYARFAGTITKTIGALGGLAAAYRVAANAAEFWRMGFAAAAEARDIQERLGVLAKQNAERWAMSSEEIVASVNKTSDAIAAFGFDTEDAQTGVMKLLKSMTPKGVAGFGEAFANLVAKLKGATPGAEGFAEVAEMVNQAVLRGRSPLFAQLGWTDKQIKAYKKLEPEQRYQLLFLAIQNKLGREARRVFDETTSGKIAKAAKAYEDLGQALTEDSVARQGKMADVQARIYRILTPIAKKLGEIIGHIGGTALDNFEKRTLPAFEEWLIANNPRLATAESAMKEIAGWMKSIQETFDKFYLPGLNFLTKLAEFYHSGAWKVLQAITGSKAEPAKLPQLPGAPPQEPIPGGAGTGGEAQRRREQGALRQFERQGYAPYGLSPTSYASPVGGALPTLRSERQRIAEELRNNPRLEQLLMASTQAEVGNQPARVQQAYMESVMNRAAATGKSLDEILRDPKYYPAMTKNKLARTFKGTTAERMRSQIAAVLSGSNIANFATGNESGSVRSGGAPILYNPMTGERFVGENWTKKWIEKMKASKGTTSATNNFNMSSPVTINGVPTGKEYAVGRHVKSALRNPMREFIDQIKGARNYDARTTYV